MKRTRCADGDVCARWASLIMCEARKLKTTYRLVIAWDDAVAYGYLGLVQALARLTTDEPAQIYAFVRLRVRGAIIDGARLEGGVPRTVYEPIREQGDVPVRVHLGGALRRHVEAHTDPPKTPEEIAMHSETQQRLASALSSLRPRDLELVIAVHDLRGIGDSGAALARRRGVGRSTVARRSRQLTKLLRRELELGRG